MGWTYDPARKVWRCSTYADLQYAEINNFAEYGQPVSPYETGYDHNHVPDFGNIIIEMSHFEVMHNGYGKDITARDFPLVNHFLSNGVMMGDTAYMPQFVERGADALLATVGLIPRLPAGSHRLRDLIARGAARDKDRFTSSVLYGFGLFGVKAGGISAADGAYIHGTVSFALMLDTNFIVTPTERRVEAEIGAGDDNWDFQSSTIGAGLNATVATLLGPDHYNLTKEIKIVFRGAGKQSTASQKL